MKDDLYREALEEAAKVVDAYAAHWATNKALRDLLTSLATRIRKIDQPAPVVTDAMVKRAHRAMMSELFMLCQPNRGDVFSFMDDRSDVIRVALTAALAQEPSNE